MPAGAIARLEITLDHVEPAVMRRIEVPVTLRLDRLHLAIQAAMGWTNSHLYEIRARDIGWGIPDRDWNDGPLDARRATLHDVLGVGTKKLTYLYDFGDGWQHTIRIERLLDPAPGVAYPRLIEAAGRCPPEDIGGPWGYAETLAAIDDPGHERHADLVDWIEPGFDPAVADTAALAADVATLARRWSRKPAAKSRSKRKRKG